MRWIGALVVLISMTVGGFEWSRRLTLRSKQIRELTTALQMFEAEVMFGHTPLKDVTTKLSATLSKPVARIFSEFAARLTAGNIEAKTAWEESLNKHWAETSMKEKEKEALLQFGQTLGQHGRFEQQKYIQLTLAHLKAEEIDARDEQQKYERMAKSLGFLGGLLAIIVMI
ncbi:stage III sporulation protein SpoIIIAB [Geomicrobium sp. JCM 19037]|uniref:stage III sporulation protein SpoIIIAB n=1 Tax=Geomicrobium sp. JCM 19037 TaxID=1460634 RepID=UPI001EE68B32|nr:stage III sporulation protein SpoIIIAB [Geomicrobium sp. JCM 19037]